LLSVARLTTQLGYPATESDIRRRYQQIADRHDLRLLVAQAGNDVAGWIHVQHTCLLESDPRIEIWGLVVDAQARGSGIGRRLVEEAEAWGRTLDVSFVTLRSNALRVGAKAFYEHLGYTITKNQNAFRKDLR
jgi:ribosomal protein S18 acetylase RimI-like enzyme